MHTIVLFLVQCNSKLSYTTMIPKSTKNNNVPKTDKLLELIMKNDTRSGISYFFFTFIFNLLTIIKL